jgi:hypothetical protein
MLFISYLLKTAQTDHMNCSEVRSFFTAEVVGRTPILGLINRIKIPTLIFCVFLKLTGIKIAYYLLKSGSVTE